MNNRFSSSKPNPGAARGGREQLPANYHTRHMRSLTRTIWQACRKYTNKRYKSPSTITILVPTGCCSHHTRPIPDPTTCVGQTRTSHAHDGPLDLGDYRPVSESGFVFTVSRILLVGWTHTGADAAGLRFFDVGTVHALENGVRLRITRSTLAASALLVCRRALTSTTFNITHTHDGDSTSTYNVMFDV
jgi:hypothetical protein